MVSRALTLLIATMFIASVWQLGSGGKIYAKAWLAEKLLAHAWQRTLDGEQHVRPWPWADTWPVAKLTIPRLGADNIILSGDSGRVLAFGAGHNEASAAPGAFGVTVISGHRDTSFSFLKDIREGDIIELKTPTQSVTYTVSEQVVVDQRYVQIKQLEANSHSQISSRGLVLVTCYPFDALRAGGDERFLVFATVND